MKHKLPRAKQGIIINIIGSIIVLLLSSLILGCVSFAKDMVQQKANVTIISNKINTLEKELENNEDKDHQLKIDLTRIKNNQEHIIKQLDRMLIKIYPGAL